MVAEVLKSKLSKDYMLAFPTLSLKIIKSTQILIITDNSFIAQFTFESIALTRATLSRGITLSCSHVSIFLDVVQFVSKFLESPSLFMCS